jgi:hypothetical protein
MIPDSVSLHLGPLPSQALTTSSAEASRNASFMAFTSLSRA